jgi:hypothetical protein
MSEWDIALAYAKGGALLNESQSIYGKLLVEGLFSNVVDALEWAGQKVSSAATKVIKAGGDALDLAGKILMQLLEKIPGGKEAFEFLKEFTGETADKIKNYVINGAKDFGSFLTEKKEEILGAIFEAGGEDSGIVARLEELIQKGQKDFGGEAEKVKKWFETFKTDPVKAAEEFFDLRKILGSIVSGLVDATLKKGGDIAKKIVRVFNSAGFTESKTGMFFLRTLEFFSVDMGGEEILTAAGRLWTAAKKLVSGGLDLERRGSELKDLIPKIVKGIVSGTSALESVIRGAAGDPKMFANIFESAVKMVRKALSNLINRGIEKTVKGVSIPSEFQELFARTFGLQEHAAKGVSMPLETHGVVGGRRVLRKVTLSESGLRRLVREVLLESLGA